MRHRKAVLPLHLERQLETARNIYRELRGEEAEEKRAAAIASLPTVSWRSRTLYTVRCHGDFGKGPHNQNLPAALLWALMDLGCYRCPYHRL